MTFTLKDIRHLEVMADLANATPAPPSKINIKELLASDTVREVGVNEKILSLCSKLRSEGFNKQAEGLESKFLAYKSAAVHLYNTHNETGEDLINAAHPDGDNAICDATGDLGHVETIVSEHKKLVNIIDKDPKGKLASRLNSKLIKKADVVISEIGKKFKYMADYIQTHALTNVPEGDSLKSEQRRFYAAAALWHQVANLIATELNSPASLPEREAVQLVKNRLQNDQSVVINQHAGQVNSIAEIDQLIHNVLSRITDKNPNKFASKLLTYVGDCEEILKNAQVGWVAGPAGAAVEQAYKMKDPLKLLFGNFAQQLEVLESRLKDLSADEGAIKFPELTKKINAALPTIAHARDVDDKVQFLIANPRNRSKAIAEANKIYTILQTDLNMLDLEVKNVYRRVENGIGSKVYHLWVISNFKWVTSSIKEVQKSISGILNELAIASVTASSGAPASATSPSVDTSVDLTQEDPTTTTSAKPMLPNAVAAVAKLNEFLPKIPTLNISDAKKSEVTQWITNQIKELQASGNDPKKVQELINEMVEFNRQLSILQGQK